MIFFAFENSCFFHTTFSSPAKKDFFFPKKTFFFVFFKMRFSIQESGKAKKFFHLPADAQKETGVHQSLIKGVLARKNSSYHRKSDNKLFFIQEEPSVKLLTVQGEDFFSMEEIQQKFGLSPTIFANQIRNQNFPHEIDWVSPEILPPGASGSEAKSEAELLQKLLATQEKMQKEIDFLSSRVLQLEKEKELQVSQERKSPEKIEETSPLPFDTSKKFVAETFESPSNFAKFCRFGIKGKISVNGPRKNKMISLEGKNIHVPDLVKELITSHIRDHMYKDGDQEAQRAFQEQYILLGFDTKKVVNIGARSKLVARIRKCDEETIHDISTEFMKLV